MLDGVPGKFAPLLISLSLLFACQATLDLNSVKGPVLFLSTFDQVLPLKLSARGQLLIHLNVLNDVPEEVDSLAMNRRASEEPPSP